MQSKPWYQSKQIWVALIGTAVEIGQYALDLKVMPTGTGTLVVGVGTILLRRFSQSDPVHFVTPRDATTPAASTSAAPDRPGPA